MIKNAIIAVLLVTVAILAILLGMKSEPAVAAEQAGGTPPPEPPVPAAPPEQVEPPPAVIPEPAVPSPLEKLESELDAMLASPEFSSAAVGFCLVDDQGEVVAGRNASQAYIPASTLKTLTTATALEVLGPDFRFETRLLGGAPISEAGELVGDLIIAGSGDPTVGPEDLAAWVEGLREAGLGKIAGRVVGDATFFDQEIAGEFSNWGDVGNGYGSPVAGLNFNRNRFKATLRPGAEIGTAAVLVDISPAVPGVEWVNRVTTGGSDDVMIYGGPRATQLVFRGTVKAGRDDYEVMGAVPDPAMFAAQELDRRLRQAGVEIGAAPAARPGVAGGELVEPPTVLYTHRSAPLSEIVRYINEVSDNHDADCLFQLLGKQGQSDGADSLIRNHWGDRGLELVDCRLVDGSGLGRANFINAVDLARLQYLARRGPQGEVYFRSLNEYYDGALRVKIGAMSRVRTYTGFVSGESGREFTFSLMFNHYNRESDVNQWAGRILPALRQL